MRQFPGQMPEAGEFYYVTGDSGDAEHGFEADTLVSVLHSGDSPNDPVLCEDERGYEWWVHPIDLKDTTDSFPDEEEEE